MSEELFLIKAPIVCLILLFWYKTNFIWVYGKLFGLSRILAIDKFEGKKMFNPDLTYQVFIATTYRGFVARLLSCTICLATWLSIFVCIGDIALTDNLLNSALAVPANSIFGVIYFFIIKKFM